MSKDPKEQRKAKKLNLKKATLRDLSVERDVNVKGGAASSQCNKTAYYAISGCTCPAGSA